MMVLCMAPPTGLGVWWVAVVLWQFLEYYHYVEIGPDWMMLVDPGGARGGALGLLGLRLGVGFSHTLFHLHVSSTSRFHVIKRTAS